MTKCTTILDLHQATHLPPQCKRFLMTKAMQSRCAGRRSGAGPARHRHGWGGRVPGRAWRSVALREPTPVDGVSWLHPIREIDWRERQSRRHHQGWQRPCTTAAHRGRVELPIPATRQQGHADQGRGRRHGQPARTLYRIREAEAAILSATIAVMKEGLLKCKKMRNRDN
jgi:hypothetical protein